MTTSSDLHTYQAHMCCTYIGADETLTNKINILKNADYRSQPPKSTKSQSTGDHTPQVFIHPVNFGK